MAHERTFPVTDDSGDNTYYINVMQIPAIFLSDPHNGTFAVGFVGIFSKTFNTLQAAQDFIDLWRGRIEDAR